MEKVTLFAADIDLQGVVEQVAEYKKEIDSLKVSQKGLDTTTQAGREQFVKNEAAIKSLKDEQREAQKVLKTLNDSSGGFLTVQEQVNKSLDNQVNTIAEARNSNKELLAIRNNLNLNSKEGVAAQEQINKKLDENNAFIKDNVSAYEKQKIGIGDYAGGIREALKDQNIFNSAQSDALGIFSRFSPVFSNLKGQLTSVVSSYKQGAVEAKSFSGAQKAMAIATNLSSTALKLFRLALISTGVGAIVVALGSLIAYLTTTQSGIDQVTKVTKPLKVIFSALFGVAQRLGEQLFNAFSNPKKLLSDLVSFIKTNVMNRFKALSVIMDGLVNLDFKKVANGFAQAATGVEDVIGKVQEGSKEAQEFLSESIKTGQELRRIGIEIEQQEAKIAKSRAISNDLIKEQELIAKDSSRSAAERNAAAEEAARLTDEQISKEEDILKLKIQELKINQTLNDTSREELKELDELEAELIAKSGERRTNELKFISAQTAFRKEQQQAAEAAEKKRIELAERASSAEIEASKLRLEQLQKELDIKSLPLTDQIKAEEELRDKKLAILKDEEQAYLNSQAYKDAIDEERELRLLQFTQSRLDLNESFADRQVEIAVAAGEKELEVIRSKNQEILKEGEFITESLKEQEEDRISNLFDAELQQLELIKTNKLISEEDYQTKKQELINNYKQQQLDVDLAFEASEAERKAANLELDIDLRRLNGESEFQLRAEQLDRERVAELESAEKTGADKLLIEEKYKKQSENLEKEKKKAQIDNQVAAAEAISGLLKELAGENKELALVAAGIDGALAIQKTLAATPFPLSLIPAAAVTARTVKNVQNIRKAEKGIVFQGTLKGKSHAEGGINLGNGIEAEGGENMYTDGSRSFIVNKKASALINRFGILGALSRINQKVGGGVPFTTGVSYAARGGLLQGNNSLEVDYNRLAEAVGSRMQDVQIVTQVTDINTEQARVNEVQDFATV